MMVRFLINVTIISVLLVVLTHVVVFILRCARYAMVLLLILHVAFVVNIFASNVLNDAPLAIVMIVLHLQLHLHVLVLLLVTIFFVNPPSIAGSDAALAAHVRAHAYAFVSSASVFRLPASRMHLAVTARAAAVPRKSVVSHASASGLGVPVRVSDHHRNRSNHLPSLSTTRKHRRTSTKFRTIFRCILVIDAFALSLYYPNVCLLLSPVYTTLVFSSLIDIWKD